MFGCMCLFGNEKLKLTELKYVFALTFQFTTMHKTTDNRLNGMKYLLPKEIAFFVLHFFSVVIKLINLFSCSQRRQVSYCLWISSSFHYFSFHTDSCSEIFTGTFSTIFLGILGILNCCRYCCYLQCKRN